METPKTNEIWQHYKHNPQIAESYTYKIIGIGLITDNSGERLVVIYQPLYEMPAEEKSKGVQMFVRSVTEFMEEVELNGQKVARFIKVR